MIFGNSYMVLSKLKLLKGLHNTKSNSLALVHNVEVWNDKNNLPKASEFPSLILQYLENSWSQRVISSVRYYQFHPWILS